MDQLDLFEASSIKNFIDYKWNTYAKYLHYFGFCIHLCYMMALALFIVSTYMGSDRYGNMESFVYPLAMAICIVYPYIYDTIQLFHLRHEYFYDPWNVSDFIYMYAGMVNIAFQF